jgi:hypothetical protein
MSKRLCLFCNAPLGEATSPEHILLQALGGRATTRRVICSKCNNNFGATFDKSLAAEVEPIRTLLNLKSGSNKAPRSLSYKSAAGHRYVLSPDGNVSTGAKPLTFVPESGGAVNVNLTLHALEEVNQFIPHIAAKMGLPEDEIRRQMEGAEAKYVTVPAPPFTANISLGGRDALRSIVKACLVLCAARTDLTAVQGAPFQSARSFVTPGTGDFASARIILEGRDIPELERLTQKFGPIFNMIFCKSDEFGRMIAYYGLYNTAYWHIMLAEQGAPPNQTFGVVSDPRAPNLWRSFDGQLFDIEMSWMMKPILGTGNRIEHSLGLAFRQRSEKQRFDYMAKIFHETMQECGLRYGDKITDEFIGKFSRSVALWWTKATFERRLTPAQLRAALG